MELSVTELMSRKTLATLESEGGYVKTENVCKSTGATWLTAKIHLNNLIAKGFARKRYTGLWHEYVITPLGNREYRKILKEMEAEAIEGRS